MKKLIKSMILLSVLPLIFISKTLEVALISGLVLLVVSMIIKGLTLVVDKFAEGKFRMYTYLLITTAIIYVINLVLGTYISSTELYSIYFALIIMNLDIIVNPEEKISVIKQLVISSLSLALLLVIGLLREVLGTGTLTIALFNIDTIQIFASKYAFVFLQQASGGFVLSGFIFGIINSLDIIKKEVKEDVL